jgi:signal transduction histidine kinase
MGTALVINTLAGTYYARRLIEKQTSELQTEIAARVAYEIEEFMENKITRLVDFSTSASFHGLGSEQQKLLALLLLKNDESFTDISILDNKGREVLKISERKIYLPTELSDQSGSVKFKKAISGDTYISPVYTSDKAEPYVTLAVPIRVTPRQVIGVAFAEANLKTLWDVVGNIQFGRAGYVYLVDGRGNLIAHRDSSLVLKRLNLSSLPEIREFLENPSAIDATPAGAGPGITGEDMLSTYAPVKKLGWAVVLAEPVAVALRELGTVQRYAGLLLGAGLLVGALIISWVSDRITNPIRTLHLGAQLIGAGKLDHRVDIKSGDEIEELAEGFNKMALELKNSYSNLEQKVEQRTREVSALYEVTTAVNESLDLQTILQAVVAKITEIFRFYSTQVYLFNDQMDLLELRAFEVETRHGMVARNFKRGQGIVGHVAESGQAIIFEDVHTDPRYAALSASRATVGKGLSFLAVFPIKTQSHVLGVMLCNGQAPRRLTGDEQRLLISMAEHVGVAVEKANLYEQARTKSQHLTVLNTIAAAVGRSLDLAEVLKEAVEKISETLGFDAAWIYQLEPEEGTLHLKAHKGLGDEIARKMAKRSAAAGVLGLVMQSGQRLVFEDVQNDERYRELSAGSVVAALGFHTASAFPIRSKEKIIGTLHIANRTKRHFTPEELLLIESISHDIGVAAENARLFSEVNEKTAELASINQELREATRAKSEFIAATSHELRTPLNIIIGNAELTRDEFFGEVNAEQKDAMQKISRNARVLLKMINDVLTLSRLEAKKMSLDVATVEVAEIIGHARTHLEQINRDHHLEVRWEVDETVPPLVTDPMKLEEILQNLIGNAVKFTPKGRIEVRVRNLEEQDRVEFSVADTGIGIEADNLEKIFKEFEQVRDGQTSYNYGVGLGLSIVKKYLDLMSGDIQVQSEPGQGSTFTFTVPRSVSLHS